jgi:hypothetical protein
MALGVVLLCVHWPKRAWLTADILQDRGGKDCNLIYVVCLDTLRAACVWACNCCTTTSAVGFQQGKQNLTHMSQTKNLATARGVTLPNYALLPCRSSLRSTC